VRLEGEGCWIVNGCHFEIHSLPGNESVEFLQTTAGLLKMHTKTHHNAEILFTVKKC